MTAASKWVALGALFLIPFLALYVSGGLFFPFIAGKHFAFRVLVEIALVAYILLALADRRYRPQRSWVLTSFALLVVWMFVADLFAVNPHKAFWSNFERMDGWVTLAHVFVLFLVAGPVLSITKLWRAWWLAFVGASALVSAYGLAQLAGLARIHQSGTRIDASLGNAEYLAGFMLLALAVTLWQAFISRDIRLRIGLFALAAAQIIVLLGTGTRGTFVALIIAALFGALLWLYESGQRGRKGALVLLAAVILCAGGFWAVRGASFIQESPNLSRFATMSLGDLDTRFKIWTMALAGAQERPVAGWGHEGFNYVFNAHYDPSLYGQEPWFDRAHNVYLDWLIAGGLPALLLFLALGASALIAVYRARELAAWERVLIISALAAYGIQGLTVFDNLFTYVPVVMLLAYAHTLRSRPIAALERLPEVRSSSLEVFAAPVAILAALLLIYMVNVPTYAAGKDLIRALTPRGTVETRLAHFERALARDPFATQEIREQLLVFAQQLVASDASPAVKARALNLAAAEIEREIARAPHDARLHLLRASFFRAFGEFDRARQAAAQARELSPNKQGIIIEQAIIEWQDGHPDAAHAFFEEAHALAPASDELVTYLAVGRIIYGDIQGGKALLEEHFGTTTINNMPLALAYRDAQAWDELVALLTLRYQELQDPLSGYQLALAYRDAGRLADARSQVRVVMREHPQTAAQGTALLAELGGE